MKVDLKKLEYTVLDKKNILDSGHYSLYCEAYDFWKETWKTIFSKVGSPESWSADDFFRQDLVPVVTYDGKIIAMHFYTFFRSKAPYLKDSKYFSIFPERAMGWIEKGGYENLMTMEFLTVHPDWRRSVVGFSFGELMIVLGSNIMLEQGADVCFGVAVQKRNVKESATKNNFSLIETEVKRGNLVCDIVALPAKDVKPHENYLEREILNHLWQSRKYSQKIEKIEKIENLKAA